MGWDPPRPLSKDGRDLLWSLAGLVGIAVENAQLLVRLHEKEQSLQGLLRKTLTAQEEERRRIARELHDETSQVLSALLMNIGLLEGHVAENGSSKARVEAVKALAAEAARNLDTMLFELRPALLDELGLVYVADMGNQIVQTYTISGEHVGSLPDTGQDRDVFGPDGFTPYDVQVANGRIVVSSSDGLYFFDDDGAVVARWGGSADGRNIRGPGEGMFNFPDSFVHDPQTGWFFVADTGNRRVIAIDENGFRKWVSGTPDVEGKVTSFWQLPRSIELGSDGNLYVVDTFRFDPEGMGTGHIVVLSKEGELLSEFGRAGETDGAFDFPDQIAAGPDGLIALADRENDRVVVFRVGTSLPAVDDLLSRRYPEGFDTPEYVWVTPPPTPPIETRQG